MEADEATAETGQETHEEVDSETERRLLERAREIARETAESVVRTIVGVKSAGGDPEEGGDSLGKGELEPPSSATTSRQIEANAETSVKEAVEQFMRARDHDDHHKHLKEAERPPQQVSRLTRMLWGADE